MNADNLHSTVSFDGHNQTFPKMSLPSQLLQFPAASNVSDDFLSIVREGIQERMNFFHLRSLFYLITPGEIAATVKIDDVLDYQKVPDYFSDVSIIF